MYSSLPDPGTALSHAYRILITDLEQQLEELVRLRFPGRLHCGPGCSSCCRAFSVLPLEGALIAETVVRQRIAPATAPGQRCALLQDDRCRIYRHRPVICRTQGVPVAYVDEAAETIEVSACPLNFADDYPLEHDDLLFLDPFNGRLAELNRRYCRRAGIEADVRLSIAALVVVTNRDQPS